MKKVFLALILAVSCFVISCKKDNVNPTPITITNQNPSMTHGDSTHVVVTMEVNNLDTTNWNHGFYGGSYSYNFHYILKSGQNIYKQGVVQSEPGFHNFISVDFWVKRETLTLSVPTQILPNNYMKDSFVIYTSDGRLCKLVSPCSFDHEQYEWVVNY